MNTNIDFNKCTIRPFARNDFSIYQSWFTDHDLNKQLGPMEPDDEWLECVMSNFEGNQQYSIIYNDELIGVAGICIGNTENADNVITDIAVKPELRSQKVGKWLVNKLVSLHRPAKGGRWVAYVDQSNIGAKRFFENNSWHCSSEIIDGMYKMTF